LISKKIASPLYPFCNDLQRSKFGAKTGRNQAATGSNISISQLIFFAFFPKELAQDGAMGASNKKSLGPLGPARGAGLDSNAGKNQDAVRRFTWAIAAISVHLEELRYFWAKKLGISGPQWMILMALADMDQADGVPVNAVSKKLHVDSSFVTTQSKLLEKKGFVRRKSSSEDARIVQMSLTDKTYKHLASLAAQQEALNEFIFAEFDGGALEEFTDKLAALQSRLEKACLKVTLDI
jgi:MarR family transcriptional regulator, organic hydroperoxide resistance regulator